MKKSQVLKVAIVGGGSGCKAIIEMILAKKLRQLRMKPIGVADINPNAVGYCYAQEKGIYTTQNYRDLYELEGLNLIVELTGQEALANEIFRTKPKDVRLMGNVAARLFWDVFWIEEQRIEERKRVEKSLKADGRFLQNVFDAIQDGVTVVDCDFNVVRINPWVEKMFASRKPLVGKKCYEAYQISKTPCPWCPTKRTLTTGQAHSEIVPFPSEGNLPRWIELSAFPLRNASGKVTGVIEHMKDITNRKRAEEDLRDSEAQKRAILNASIDMIRYVDEEMKIIWANKKTVEELDIAHEEIKGRTCYELFLGRDFPCEGCPTEKVLETGEIEHAIMLTPGFGNRKSQSYWDCYSVPVKDESGEIVRLIQVARDVTEQKEAEKELERRHKELEAINAVLFSMTREYNLNGMCRVLQGMMEEFYPGFQPWIFLITPKRDCFFFPRPDRGEIRATCYDQGKKRLKGLNVDNALLELLTKGRMRPMCSGNSEYDRPRVIEELASGFSTWLAVPIEVEGEYHGLFMLSSPAVDMEIEEDLAFVEVLIRQISGVIRYQIAKEVREEAFRSQLTGPDKFKGLVGRSQTMQKIYRMIESVANSSSTVLITGESGTGKELVARAIYRTGKYKDTPFVVAHCSSFVPTLVHSEIFGHEKGAFTGAVSRKRGRLERAQGGILFLDEVADLPLETQVLLLRFLQDRSFERVGGERLVKVNVRIIAATNKDIEKEMKAGRLREDFYYRLNVLPVKVPPLREHVGDIPLLADHFLRTYSLVEGKEVAGFDAEALKLMMDYDWPGNVRELQNTVARCVVLAARDRISADVLPDRMRTHAELPEYSLAKNEKKLIERIMRECNWNKHEAARLMDISRGTLYSKLKRYGISR